MTEKLFTEEEVNHLVSREVAKQRMHDLERSVSEVKSDAVKRWAKFDANFETLHKAIDARDNDLRREFERDFASKPDLESLRSAVNLTLEQIKSSINILWLKVTIPLGTLLVVAEWFFKLSH